MNSVTSAQTLSTDAPTYTASEAITPDGTCTVEHFTGFLGRKLVVHTTRRTNFDGTPAITQEGTLLADDPSGDARFSTLVAWPHKDAFQASWPTVESAKTPAAARLFHELSRYLSVEASNLQAEVAQAVAA